MTTFKLFSGVEKSCIRILVSTNLTYRFEYADFCDRTYLHIEGVISDDIKYKLNGLSY